MTRLAMLVMAVTVAGCGDGRTPTAPSPPPPAQIAGNWVGTFTYTPASGGQRTIVAVTASFTQAGGQVTGQVNITGGSLLVVSGVVDRATLTATVQYSAPAPSPCTGTASISGTVSSTQVRFVIPSIASGSGCTFFTNGEFVLTK